MAVFFSSRTSLTSSWHITTIAVLGKRKKGPPIRDPTFIKETFKIYPFILLSSTPFFLVEDDKKLDRIATSPTSEFYQEKILRCPAVAWKGYIRQSDGTTF